MALIHFHTHKKTNYVKTRPCDIHMHNINSNHTFFTPCVQWYLANIDQVLYHVIYFVHNKTLPCKAEKQNKNECFLLHRKLPQLFRLEINLTIHRIRLYYLAIHKLKLGRPWQWVEFRHLILGKYISTSACMGNQTKPNDHGTTK